MWAALSPLRLYLVVVQSFPLPFYSFVYLFLFYFAVISRCSITHFIIDSSFLFLPLLSFYPPPSDNGHVTSSSPHFVQGCRIGRRVPWFYYLGPQFRLYCHVLQRRKKPFLFPLSLSLSLSLSLFLSVFLSFYFSLSLFPSFSLPLCIVILPN